MDRRWMTVVGMSLVAGVCSVGIMGSPARAEDEEPKDLKRIDHAVQLTDAQREQVQQILQDFQMRRQQLVDQLKALKEEEDGKIRAVLTPEQQDKFDHLRQRRQERHHKHHQSEAS